MVLFPQARAAVEQGAGDLPAYDPAFSIAETRAAARAEALAQPREDVAEVRDLDADGVRVRLHRPDGAEPGVVVHLHGGGFVLNDVDVHDASARRLANRSRCAVLSVAYRKPPEHRFPAAPDDVSTVVRWLDREAAALGLDGPAYVHGDSAGGNLALVAALRHPGRFAAAALVYPFLDPDGPRRWASWREVADGFDPREADWYWAQYAASAADLRHPDLAPLEADDAALATLPPTLVVTAEHDPLRDEGEELARRLAALGVRVTSTRYQGQVHGFWRHPDAFDAAEPLMVQVAGFLRLHRG